MTSKKKSPKQMAIHIEVSKRRTRIMEMIVKGHKDKAQMSAALNITEVTLGNDLTWLYSRCGETDRERLKALFHIRTEQLEYLYRTAIREYEKSTQAAKEEIVVRIPEKCPECKGTGFKNETDWCENCEGECKIIVETVTTKIKQKTGDTAFLAEARKNLELLIRMEGHDPPKEKHIKKDILETKIHTHVISSTPIPSDLLLEFLETYAKLDAVQKKDAIEVSSVAVTESENP